MIIDLNRVIVAARRNLSHAVECSMTDAETAGVLADLNGFGRCLAQIPETHCPIQGCGCEKVGVLRMDTEASNLLLRQFPDLGCWF